MRTSTTRQRLTAFAAIAGGAMAAAAGALQATNLDWDGTKVSTTPQHIVMALFAAALVLTIPAALALGNYASGRLCVGRFGIAAGQFSIAFAATVSNIRGEDASWFAALAGPGNLVWALGSIALAIALYRSARVPRTVALGVVVAYVATIPMGMLGGGIIAGAYWLTVGYLLLHGAIERRALQPATA